MFTITQGKGFQIKFENGYTVSCQFGSTNYCEHRSFSLEPVRDFHSSKDCEVAIWNKNDKWITGKILEAIGMESQEEMVQGWVIAEDVAKILAYVATLTN